MSEVPDALRLARLLELDKWPDAAEELRRLHVENQSLQSEAADNACILGTSAETELALRARVVELERYKKAWEDWQDKTEWVQETARPTELGMHRADVLKLRIQKLVNVTLQARIIANSAIRTKSRDKQDWIDDMVAIEEITKGASE